MLFKEYVIKLNNVMRWESITFVVVVVVVFICGMYKFLTRDGVAIKVEEVII